MNRVTCINKSNRGIQWDRILELGGTRDDNGEPWLITKQECIRHIEDGAARFYVQVGDHRAYLEVETGPNGGQYVRTKWEEDPQGIFLTLPECVS